MTYAVSMSDTGATMHRTATWILTDDEHQELVEALMRIVEGRRPFDVRLIDTAKLSLSDPKWAGTDVTDLEQS